MNKTVNLAITVPASEYCWEYGSCAMNKSDIICQYFSNEGGHCDCDLKLGDQKSSVNGILKPLKCRDLTNVATN